MPGPVYRRLAEFVRSPQGRRVLREAKRLADPGRRRQIDQLRRRLMGRGPEQP